jgi:hypothetical protein
MTALARTTDPDTSHEAAASVTNSAKVQAAILDLLSHRPFTDDELSRLLAYRMTVSPSGLRTRRAELVRLGKVVDSGERVRLRSGRRAIVWALSEDVAK